MPPDGLILQGWGHRTQGPGTVSYVPNVSTNDPNSPRARGPLQLFRSRIKAVNDPGQQGLFSHHLRDPRRLRNTRRTRSVDRKTYRSRSTRTIWRLSRSNIRYPPDQVDHNSAAIGSPDCNRSRCASAAVCCHIWPFSNWKRIRPGTRS